MIWLTRTRRLEPAGQRLKRLLARLRGGPAKGQSVHLVEIGGARLKRLVMADSYVAQEIADKLEELRELDVVPKLVARYRNELWLEYVEGAPLGAVTDVEVAPLEELADVYAALYKLAPRLVTRSERDFLPQVERDLDVLATLEVVERQTLECLRTTATRSAPSAAWVGHDYGDPRPQNFVRARSGRLRIIDVESLRRDALIGIGAARAWLRWPGLDRGRFTALLAARGAPDFTGYLDFLEVAFAATWTKRCALHRKENLIDRDLLARLAGNGR